jgi:SNF2-related domain/Helicase conserved C-terminal domain
MQHADMPDIDPASLRDAVDSGSYRRGVAYSHQRAVIQLRWEPSKSALQGLVRGSAGALYTTIAYFTAQAEFDHGVCSCPVGLDCKHVVALVQTALEDRAASKPAHLAPVPDEPVVTGPVLTRPVLTGSVLSGPVPAAPVLGAAGPGEPPPGRADQAAELAVPGWEMSLGALFDSGDSWSAAAARPALTAGGQPALTALAIELSYTAGSQQPATRWQPASEPVPKLQARLVQPGRNGGWVASSLSWSRLDYLRYYGSYSAAQVQVLHDLHALFRSGNRENYYGYGDQKSINLLAFESRQLWALLDEAEAAGLRLVYPRKLGVVPKYSEAELCIDVTGADSGGSLLISPVIRVGGALADVRPVSFLGTEGHGLVYVADGGTAEGAESGKERFLLARLARPVPAQLQWMALAGQRLEIPAADLAAFRDRYYPRLRLAAPTISSDSSFEPPVISGPELVLLASYLPDHELSLRWEWAYQVGDSQLRVPPDGGLSGNSGQSPAAAACRDLEAEQCLLAELDVPADNFGLLGDAEDGRLPGGPVRLNGIETMRFTTELLPLLDGQPGVIIDVAGEAADYREASDSLRIGVSAGELAGDTDWFDLGITISVDGRPIPFSDVFVALSQDQSHLLLSDGAYFSLDKPELQALARLIDEARALQDAPPGELRISRFQAGLWDELAELGVVSHQAAVWQEQVSGLLAVSSVTAPAPPAALRAQLRPYQLDGFGWLAFLWQHRLGGILADDMGLGKTLQSLALICHARETAAGTASAPFLIVAPTSVVQNWTAEAARFAPDLTIVPISETGSRRGTDLAATVAGADAVVTSYALLRLDFESYSALPWAGLILDEAQFTKNHQSKIYQCARRLQAPFKLAITGTPMENNLMELWSLLSITSPGLFPSPDRFRDYYARPIERSPDAELLAQLRRRIRPLVLRRTKEQVATDLPAKQEQVVMVDLHPRHRKVYQTHLQRERQKVLGLIDDMNANRFTIFRSLTLLRQLSLHAGLVDDTAADIPSAKIEMLAEQLRDVIGGGHRALVFSQFTSFLGIVAARLEAEGVPYCYLDGRTRDRAAVIGRFKDGRAPVFLISLKAGGFGLNLTEADYCFLLDPWWNPATEAQAVDRTHRIGQTRNVMVYRLIARDTIEEKVMALKARKAELFASVLDEGNVFGASLDAQDIRGLFS